MCVVRTACLACAKVGWPRRSMDDGTVKLIRATRLGNQVCCGPVRRRVALLARPYLPLPSKSVRSQSPPLPATAATAGYTSACDQPPLLSSTQLQLVPPITRYITLCPLRSIHFSVRWLVHGCSGRRCCQACFDARS
jgi:hypothetical protein